MEGCTGGFRIVSRRAVRPEPGSSPDAVPSSEHQTMDLTPWDLQFISVHYIQKGVLLPAKTAGSGADVDDLASSFAQALGRFYPLAGRFTVTENSGGGDDGVYGASLAVSLCCNDQGAEFIHAVAPEVSVSDIAAPLHYPPVLRSFFPLNGMVCGDAMLEPRPVLAAQVTELADGAFVALSLNHAAADGTTFWHLFNTWSEIHRCSGQGRPALSTPPPVLGRWFPETCPVPPIALPFRKVEDIIQRVEFPPLHECFFHLSAENVRDLKAKANAELTGTHAAATISSLQAVLSHLWRAASRARRLAPDRETICLLPVGCRGRVKGVPQHYMGNAVELGMARSTVADVLDKGLGCTACLLNQAVASFDEAKTKDMLASWHHEPHILYLEGSSGDPAPADIAITCSPRFDVYGNDFGWGVPVAVRSGAGNKTDGLVTIYPGHDGNGSMGVEICLSWEALARLTADSEFMEVVDML